MDENPISHPGVPMDQYHTLGGKTLGIFVLQRIQASLILLLVSVVLFVVQGQSFLSSVPIPKLPTYINLAAWACFFLFAFFFGFSFLIAWLVYINYKFYLDGDCLKIKRGILNKEEIAIPYRQIQDVDIERDLSFRMFGVSRIVILTAGHEEEPKNADDETEGILPALDKDLAEWLQAELLKRANVQKVVEGK